MFKLEMSFMTRSNKHLEEGQNLGLSTDTLFQTTAPSALVRGWTPTEEGFTVFFKTDGGTGSWVSEASTLTCLKMLLNTSQYH